MVQFGYRKYYSLTWGNPSLGKLIKSVSGIFVSSYRRTFLRSHEQRLHKSAKVFLVLARSTLLLYVLYMGIFWITHRPVVILQQLEVTGVHATDPHDVLQIVKHTLASSTVLGIRRDNALLYPRTVISDRVKGLNYWITGVDLVAGLHGDLRLRVHERTPDALWCAPDASEQSSSTPSVCYFADEEGVIFDQAPIISGQTYVRYITGATGTSAFPPYLQETLPPEERIRVRNFITQLAMINIHVLQVRALEEHDYELSSQMPWVLRWESQQPPGEGIVNLSTVLATFSGDHTATKTPEMIDLRFGDKVFYR